MKKFLLLLIWAGVIHNACADSVAIRVTGNIVGATCMVDNGSKSASVEMGEATSGQFQQAGTTGDWVDFELSLSQCPSSVTQVTSTFNGTADADAPDYFASTGTGTGVGLELSSGDHSKTLSAGSQLTTPVNSSDGTVTLPLAARYVATKGNATGGTFISTVQVTFTYE